MNEKISSFSFSRGETVLKLFLYGSGLLLLGVIFCAIFLEAGLQLGPDQLAELAICILWLAPLLLGLITIVSVLLFLPLYRQGPALTRGGLDTKKAAWIWKQLMIFPARGMLLSMMLWIAGVLIVVLWMIGKSSLAPRNAVPAAICCALLGMTTAVGFYFCARHAFKPVLTYVCEFLPPGFSPPRIRRLDKKQFVAFIFIIASFCLSMLVEAYFLMDRAKTNMTLSVARERIREKIKEPESIDEYTLRPFTVDFEGQFSNGVELMPAQKEYIRRHHRLLGYSHWRSDNSFKSSLASLFARFIELPDYAFFSQREEASSSTDAFPRQWILLQREPAAGGLHPGMVIEHHQTGLMAEEHTSLFLLALFFVTIMFTAVLYSRWICRDVVSPLNELGESIKVAAEKQEPALSPVITDDEIGELTASFNSMGLILEQQMQSTRQTLRSIGEAVRDLNQIMQNLSSLSSEQAGDATEHATSMQEVTSTSEEIAATLRTIAENAQNVEDVAGKSLSACRSGQDQLQAVVSELDEASSRSSELGMRMLSLQEQANRIEGILEFIQEISEKTNLIALNASIEASAVEEGQRFPIIAKEMRKLAESTMSGAKEIRSVLEDLQEATGKAIISTEEGEKKVGAARDSSEQAAENFQSIIHWAGETSRAAKEIALSSNQQTSATDHLASALGEIKDVASRFAEGTSHLNDFMSELEGIASKLGTLLENKESVE